MDNTNNSGESGLYPFEDFLTKTDQFLSSIFKEAELKVDDQVINRILKACK